MLVASSETIDASDSCLSLSLLKAALSSARSSRSKSCCTCTGTGTGTGTGTCMCACMCTYALRVYSICAAHTLVRTQAVFMFTREDELKVLSAVNDFYAPSLQVKG